MSNFLEKIMETKRRQVTESMRKVSQTELKKAAENRTDRRNFFNAVTADSNQVKIIAEIKRASPSRGDINPELDVKLTARQYETGGACAISVLTETDYFKGSPEDIQLAKAVTSLPVLRKDFIFCDYQVYESATMGADAILIIARILKQQQVRELVALCHELKMDALVEIHGPEDLEKIATCDAKIIGINNRDLTTFKTDIETAKRVAKELNHEQTPIALSGICSSTDIQSYMDSNIRCFLVGESIVKSGDPENFIKGLKQ